MTCPKCSAPMEAVTVGVTEVDRCTSCSGIWFDLNEDEWLKRKGGAAIVDTGDPEQGRSRNQQGRINCPRCHTRMMQMVDPGHPHVSFESCAVCYGSFFDAGEFREVASGTGVLDILKRWISGGRH